MKVSPRRLLRNASFSSLGLILFLGVLVMTARAALYTSNSSSGASWTATTTGGVSVIWNCTTVTAGDVCATYPGQNTFTNGIVDQAVVSSSAGSQAITVDSAIPNPVNLTIGPYTDSVDVTASGTLTLAGTSSITGTSGAAALSIDGGHLTNNGTATFDIGSTFNLNYGTFDGTGITNMNSGASLVVTGTAAPINVNQQTINNSGGANFTTNGTMNMGSGAALNNQATGIFTGDGGATIAPGAGSALFSNVGIVQNTDSVGSSFTVGVPFDNDNAATLLGGTSGSFSFTGGGTHSGGSWALGGGTMNFGGAHVLGGTETFTGAGAINIPAGGGWSINTTASLLALPAGANVTNSGSIDFGTAIHGLAVNGTYTQTATGILMPKLGPPNGNSDQVGVAGVATIAGTLAPTFGTGYVPADGDSFTVLTSSSSVSGTFTYTPISYATGKFLISYPPGAVVLTATPMASVSIADSGPPTVVDGQNATYTITVTNTGPSSPVNATVADTFSGGTYVSATPSSGSCTPSGSSFTCSGLSVPIGTPQTITVVLKAAGSPGPLSNTATLSIAPVVNTGSPTTATATTTVNPAADLSLSSPITSTPAVGVAAGGTETFFVAFNNAGPDATGSTVTVTFSLTGGTITGASSPGWTCTTSQCTIPTLNSGSSGTITVTTTAQNQAGSMTLTANISSAASDPVPGNNSASSAAVPVTGSADLSITKTVSGTIVAGSNATYTITITNNGPSDATGVTLTDATPAGFTFVSATAPCSAGVTSCSIGTIPSAVGTNIVTITVVYSVPSSATGSVTNTASVNATTSDPVPGNNSATTPATTITTSADLAVSKSGPSTATVGSNVTYTVSVTNNGPSDAQGVTLSDPTPSGLSFVSASGACSSFPCSIATIPAGQTKTTQATYKVNSGPVTNVASVTATTTDPSSSNNSASVNTTTAAACPTAPPANPSPADGSTNIPTSGVLSWNGDGASSYTVYLDVAGPNACSKFFGSTSSTSIPYAGLQQGTVYQWRIVASGSGCPTVQATSCMTFTTAGSTCPQSAPTLISPLNTTVNGPPTFTWSSVTGATDYRLFVNGSLVATTTSTSFGPVPVGSGSVSWYVIADFASPCGSLQSPPGSFNGCDTTSAPIASVVGKAASGQTYDVSWDAIAGATQYQIDEATDVNFSAPTTQTVTSTTVSFSHSVTTTTAYFYRVRAFDPCANGYSANSITVRVVLTPLSIVSTNPNVAAPAGSKKLIQVIVHVPGFADGSFPFTATLDQPWLVSVDPATGTLPPQGIDLTVSVDPTGLTNGTWTGTVILAIGAGKAGLIGTNGTTTVSAPVSVSLVTPVTPLPAGTPSASTLIIPSLGHLDGINSQWQSDVRLANLSSTTAQYQVTFTPADTSVRPRQTVITVDPGTTTALDDVINTWFGVGALGDSANGVLQIQPMQTSGKNDSVSVSLATVASSRTYNLATNSNGTYGQFIPAIPFSSFVGVASSGHPATVLGLQQIAQSSSFRTNVGIVEGAGQPATVLISAFDDAGNKLLDFPLNINPNQQVQLNSFLAQNNIPLSDGRLQIKVLNGSGMITTYASVIDNRSGDPLLMTGVPIGQTTSSSYVLPGVADLNTANAAWRTDMRIFNPTSTAQFVTATFYPQNNGTPQMTSFTVNPGQIDRIDSALATLFNGAAANMGGALHLTLGNPTSLVVTGRTYNFASNGGTYGQFIPAVTAADAVGNGDRALQILQTEDSVRERTNVGIAEVTGNPATVQISVVIPGSKVSPSTQIPLQANEFIQIPVIQSLGLTNVYNARISVQVVGGTGKIAAYGSVIDQTTQAPTYIPAQ